MQIRQKLTYQFVSIVAVILLLFSIAVYYFSSQYRKENFYDRLKNKAINVANLLSYVNKIDRSLLEKIEKDNPVSLPAEKIIVYNPDDEILFNSDTGHEFNISNQQLDRIRRDGELRYRQGKYEMLGILFTGKEDQFAVVAGAVDIYGLKKLENLKTILLIAFGICIIIIFIAGGIYAKRALLPISNIIRQVDNISANSMGLRVEEGNKKDEIARLAGTFNNMLGRLASAFTVQKNFIANASHELRTPLTSISGELEVLMLQRRSPEQYNEAINSVMDDVKKMKLITNRLILLAQASAEYSEAKFKPVRIDELLWQTKGEIEKINPAWQINITFDPSLSENHLTIAGNDQLLRSLLFNLAENSCKYSADNTVEVFLTTNGNQLILIFRDNGIGIPAAELQDVFEPFYRGTNADQFVGHGIGLSLVQKILQLHKGSIQIESELNKGTSITVFLPAANF